MAQMGKSFISQVEINYIVRETQREFESSRVRETHSERRTERVRERESSRERKGGKERTARVATREDSLSSGHHTLLVHSPCTTNLNTILVVVGRDHTTLCGHLTLKGLWADGPLMVVECDWLRLIQVVDVGGAITEEATGASVWGKVKRPRDVLRVGRCEYTHVLRDDHREHLEPHLTNGTYTTGTSADRSQKDTHAGQQQERSSLHHQQAHALLITPRRL
jgi:hypothetical protein